MPTGSEIQQRKMLHVKGEMNQIIKIVTPVFMSAILLVACAPKIYQPPHLGAEYRFDEGLRSEKPQEQLFSKDMHQYLLKTGVEQTGSGGAPVATAPKTSTNSKAVSDTTQKNQATTIAPASLPTSSDSSHSEPH